MKNVKKLVLIGVLVLLLTGCSNKNFVKNYKQMIVKDKGINGYTLDLRIYGNYKNKIINELVRVQNYKNNQYEIRVSKGIQDETIKIQDEVYYIRNKKVYTLSDGKKVDYTTDIPYKKPDVYLEGLTNITRRGRKVTEKIGQKDYSVYSVIFQKKIVNKLLKDTILNDLTVDKDMDGKIYLDMEGYVYKIIYYINDITIDANYFGINQAREVY